MVGVTLGFLLHFFQVVGDDPRYAHEHHSVHLVSIVYIPGVDRLVIAVGFIDELVVERGDFHGVSVSVRVREGQVIRQDVADELL